VSWIRWVQAVRADPEKSWELGPPYEDLECCFICQCDFSLFVRPSPAPRPLASTLYRGCSLRRIRQPAQCRQWRS
jgi:hypothetical protein